MGNKTVRHQDISAPVEKDSSAPRHFCIKKVRYQDKSAPHFLSNKRDYLFKIKSTKVKKTPIKVAMKLKDKFSQGFI
jgi:hypothetical protein